jgi:hypothetical protein
LFQQRPATAYPSVMSAMHQPQPVDIQRPSTGGTMLPIHQVMTPTAAASSHTAQPLTIEQQVTRRHRAVIRLQRFWRRRRLRLLCRHLAQRKGVLARFVSHAWQVTRRRRIVRCVTNRNSYKMHTPHGSSMHFASRCFRSHCT